MQVRVDETEAKQRKYRNQDTTSRDITIAIAPQSLKGRKCRLMGPSTDPCEFYFLTVRINPAPLRSTELRVQISKKSYLTSARYLFCPTSHWLIQVRAELLIPKEDAARPKLALVEHKYYIYNILTSTLIWTYK